MRLNYHIIFQYLNLLSPRLRQFHRRKMPLLSSPVPLQLHLKALLEDLDPSAVIIKMIAMLFAETLMGQRGRFIFKSRQRSAIFSQRAIINRTEDRKSVFKDNRERSGASLYILQQTEQDPTFRLPLEGSCQIPSSQISSSTRISWAGTGIMV